VVDVASGEFRIHRSTDMSPKVAIVTGANKGIGLAVVRALCQQFEGTVYLTARNAELGQKAVEDCQKVKWKVHVISSLISFYDAIRKN